MTTSKDPRPTSPAKPAAESAAKPAAESAAAGLMSLPVLSTQPVTVEKGLAIVHGTPILPSRHPNLGLAPIDMKSGFAGAAARVRADKAGIAARGLEAAVKADRTLRDRYDDLGLRKLLRDGELLVERLAMSLGSDDVRWIAQYAEWVGPTYRRRGVPLADLATLCAGVREVVAADLDEDELAAADHALDAAQVVLRRNGRVAGDQHKRRALFKWMYRGV